MKTNEDYEKKREQFDEACEAAATEQSINSALKASSAEKDELINHLIDRIDRLEEELSATLQWRGCHG